MMPGAKKRKSRSSTHVAASATATRGDLATATPTATRPQVPGRPAHRGSSAHNAFAPNKHRRSFLENLTTTGEPPSLAPDDLIPIRVDVTVDGRRVQDAFSWNPDERAITPHAFAAVLVADLALPPSATAEIADQINEQISAHLTAARVAAASAPSPPKHAILGAQPARVPGATDASGGKAGGARRAKECRHIVRLNVRVGGIVIRDQFEWDMNETDNNPDAFSEQLCADLGLNTEHVAIVVHALRTQLCEISQFQERRPGCPTVTPETALRANVEAWGPALQKLSPEEQQKLERKEIREARLQRRNRGKVENSMSSRPSSRVQKARAGRRRTSRQTI